MRRKTHRQRAMAKAIRETTRHQRRSHGSCWWAEFAADVAHTVGMDIREYLRTFAFVEGRRLRHPRRYG